MKITEPTVLMAREHQPQEINYQARLGEITGRQLDASNLTSYADEALKDLVSLVEQAIDQTAQDTIPWVGAEQERRALEAVGLPPDQIETTLLHIQYVADSIHGLDDLVARKTKEVANAVIVPTDPAKKVEITAGDGSFKEREKRPKLHTLLLLLKINHGINLEDDDQLSILPGRLLPNMMRGISYHLVQIPSLDRMVLVCDELGEATHVFDSEKCSDYGIAPEYIQVQEKPELEDLQDMDPALVRRIIYTDKSYASRLNDALTSPLDSDDEVVEPVNLLEQRRVHTEMPEGYKTIEEAMVERGIASRSAFCYRIGKVNLALGQLERCYISGVVSPPLMILSPEQLAMIDERFPNDIVSEMPLGYKTTIELMSEMGMAQPTFSRLVRRHSEEIGDVRRYKGPGSHGINHILSPEQQAIILGIPRGAKVNEVVVDEIPEGCVRGGEFATELDVHYATLIRWMSAIGDMFGERLGYRQPGVGHGNVRLFTPEQQQMLREHQQKVRLGKGKVALAAAGQ